MPARMIVVMLVALLISIPAIAQDIDSQLIEAAKNGQAEKVQALLEVGADVDAKDEDGITALWAAAAGGHTDIVRTLLDGGADVNTRTNNGLTALMASRGHPEVSEILQKAGAKE